jgi:HD-GYP domain-containing protein (c-di-GMP phosphodiesterase class II)
MNYTYIQKKISSCAIEDCLEINNHGVRVCIYSVLLAQLLNLDDLFLAKLTIAAREHDTGKLLCDPKIINKPGPLSKREFEETKKHPMYSAMIYSTENKGNMDLDIFKFIKHHHENMDGKGYPNGLKGEDIPLGARIIRLADTFDALTKERCYKPAITPSEALKIIKESYSCYDPVILKTFIDNFQAFEDCYNNIDIEIK